MRECAFCSEPLERREGELLTNFQKRITCGRSCASNYNNMRQQKPGKTCYRCHIVHHEEKRLCRACVGTLKGRQRTPITGRPKGGCTLETAIAIRDLLRDDIGLTAATIEGGSYKGKRRLGRGR